MEFLQFFGFILIIIILFKLFVFLIGLLSLEYGRKFGLGVKYQSENGEFAVISGATGSIGREFTQEFASMGYNLILIAKDNKKLDQLEYQIRKKYNTMKHIVKIVVDLTKLESYDLIRKQLSDINPIVVLINCSSRCSEPDKFWKLSSITKQDLIMINVMAPLILIDILLPRFIQQNRGIIINVGSQAGDFRFPKYSTYSACKSFIHTLTEILATECNNTNVYIQTVKPCLTTNIRHLHESFFKISSRLVAHSALMTVGFETSHYGHWKHRLSALLFNTLVFIFGHRFTTFIIGIFLPTFFQTNRGNQKQRTPSSSATNIELSSTSMSPSSISPSLDFIMDNNSSESDIDVVVDFDDQQNIKSNRKYAPTPSSSSISSLVDVELNDKKNNVIFKLTPPSCIKQKEEKTKSLMKDNNNNNKIEIKNNNKVENVINNNKQQQQ